MRGVIYARYSEGPRQTDQSIEGQVADCRAFAQQKGVDIIGLYADRHVSGKSVDGRDEFQRMMRDADRGLFDAVIVWKVDRFGRSREDIAVNKIRLRKAGVVLMYAKESIPEGPEGILLESLMEGLAEYYSADLRQKIIRGQRESAKKGRLSAGRLPTGYKRDEAGHVVIDEETAPAIRELFRAQAAGAGEKEKIAILKKHGISCYSSATVHRILRNERYLGRFELHGVPIEAPAIIDEDLFTAAQARFKTTRNAAGRAKVRYLLSCKCYCGKCGRMLTGMTGTGKSGKKYTYYNCLNHDLKPIAREELEDEVIRHTRQDVLTDEVIGKLVRRIMEIQEAQADHSEEQRLASHLKDLRRRRDNVARAIEDGADSLIGRLHELEEEIRTAEVDLEKEKLRDAMVPEGYIKEWLESFRDGDVSDPAFRQRLVDAFVAEVVVSEEDIVVLYNTKEKEPARCSRTAPKMEYVRAYANSGPAILGGFIILRIRRRIAIN